MILSSAHLLLLTCLGSSQASAQVPKTESPEEPRVVLESPTGELRRRPLAELSQDWLADPGMCFLRFEGLAAEPLEAPPADPAQVLLVGGGRARGSLAGGEGEFLDLRLQGGSRLRLSIEEFSSFRFPARFPEAWSEPVEAPAQGDRLYRLSGGGLDRIDGTFESFAEDGVSFDTSLGLKTFAWDEVAALFIEVLEASPATQPLPAVVVDLLDGSRLPMGLIGLSELGLDLVTSAGRGLRLPLSVVAEVSWVRSDVLFLSEREPLEAPSSRPFGDDLGMQWPLRRDLSTSGAPLRAGGKRWTRGLGVHAPVRLKWALDGRWKHLRGFVAVDDEVLPLPAEGSVIFRVLGGGKLLWESPVMRGGDAPLRMADVSLVGVEELTLECLVADNLHLGDRADWLRMVLSR